MLGQILFKKCKFLISSISERLLRIHTWISQFFHFEVLKKVCFSVLS